MVGLRKSTAERKGLTALEMRLETINNVTVVHVDGDIFAEDSTRLKDTFDKLFHTNKVKVVLNLDKTDVISSVGLGVILAALIKFRKYSGDICLAGVRDFVKKILRTTKVDSIIETVASVPIAVEAFNAKAELG